MYLFQEIQAKIFFLEIILLQCGTTGRGLAGTRREGAAGPTWRPWPPTTPHRQGCGTRR